MSSPKVITAAPHIGALGLQPYGSRNIALSSALWAMGFAPKINAQPTTVVVDFETKQPVVTFWHETHPPADSQIARKLPNLIASHIGEWWSGASRTGGNQYSIDGYDDALHAMRRVREMREWLIKVVKGAIRVPSDGRLQRATVTESLHIASVIKACGESLVAFDRGTFVFSAKAGKIASLIDAAASKDPASNVRPLSSDGTDPCIDWMLAALHHGDALKRFVRACVPLIEKNDGDRCLRISSQMPKTLRREFTRRF
jgi:hypothetical protein